MCSIPMSVSTVALCGSGGIIGNIHHSASHRLDVKIHSADMYNTVFVRYLIA